MLNNLQQIITILFIIILIPPSSGQDSIQKKVFSAEELAEDIDYLFYNLEQIHPDLYFYTPKAAVNTLMSGVDFNKPMTRFEFSLNIIPIVSSLDDAHTSVYLPQEERTDYLNTGGTIFPFDVRISNNRLYVRSSYCQDTTIAKNSEIFSVNNIPVDQILEKMRKYVSAELDIYRDVRVEMDFRRLLWFLYGSENTFKLEIEENNDKAIKIVKGLSVEDFRSVRESQVKANLLPYRYYELSEGQVGVIDFRQMTGTKRFKTFLDSVFAEIEKKEIQHLVIDIRQNGGGNSNLAKHLFNYITDEPYKMADTNLVKISSIAKHQVRSSNLKWYLYPLYPVTLFIPQARPYFFGTTGKMKTFSNEKMIIPANVKHKFDGKTYLLTGHLTFSSASMLAAAYKCYKMGTVIGEETGGILSSFGDLVNFQLPNTKLTVSCSHKKFVLPCYDNKIHGIMPDIKVIPSNEDIMEGRDAAIEYLLKSINSPVK